MLVIGLFDPVDSHSMEDSSTSELQGLPKLGTVLGGKYRLERVLGVGGMGAVVLAEHEQLGERVAIKFLLGKASQDPERIKRFSREAWAAAKIKSDHVVRVLDIASMEDGTPYLVLEYLEGEDLEAVLHQHGPMPVEVAVDYVLQAAEALAEAHRLGIIHRDLKPGNIHRSYRPDGSAWIKVLDFGISKFTRQTDAITKTSTLMGSPLYMAPEQLASAKHVDPRVDVWALAVILYELVSGKLPFTGETLPQICTSVLHRDPIPVTEHAPHVPSAFWTVLQHALEKLPDDRYESLVPFARDLTHFGSEGAKTSAAYISRVLGDAPLMSSGEHSGSYGRISVDAAEAVARPDPHALPRLESAPSTSLAPDPSRSPMRSVGAATSAPVVSDSVMVTGPQRGIWAVGAAVVALVALAGVAISVSSEPTPTLATGVLPAADVGASVQAAVPELEAAPAASVPAAPTSSASATPANSASVEASATVPKAPPPRPRPVPPRKIPRPKPFNPYGAR